MRISSGPLHVSFSFITESGLDFLQGVGQGRVECNWVQRRDETGLRLSTPLPSLVSLVSGFRIGP